MRPRPAPALRYGRGTAASESQGEYSRGRHDEIGVFPMFVAAICAGGSHLLTRWNPARGTQESQLTPYGQTLQSSGRLAGVSNDLREQADSPRPDSIRFGASAPGLERAEVYLSARALKPHRHDTASHFHA